MAAPIISIAEHRRKKRIEKTYDGDILYILEEGWRQGLVSDVIVLAKLEDGSLGVLANGVEKEAAINMIASAFSMVKQDSDDIVG